MSQPEASKQPPEQLRIGVFICHCGLNIAGTVDIKQLVEYAKTIPDVVYVKENRYTCADPGQAGLSKAGTRGPFPCLSDSPANVSPHPRSG